MSPDPVSARPPFPRVRFRAFPFPRVSTPFPRVSARPRFRAPRAPRFRAPRFRARPRFRAPFPRRFRAFPR